eukprot:572838-Amphidinium_carterae.1
MSSFRHDPRAPSQNVGNVIGTRPCIRQSELFRQRESGNAMKGFREVNRLRPLGSTAPPTNNKTMEPEPKIVPPPRPQKSPRTKI